MLAPIMPGESNVARVKGVASASLVTGRTRRHAAFGLPCLAGVLASALSARPARADAPPAASEPAKAPRPAALLGADVVTRAEGDGFHPSLVLDTGRTAPRLSSGSVTFDVHGEYQLRYRPSTDLRLEASPLRPEANKLGQNQYLYHWFRLSPRLSYKNVISLVGQADFPRGLIGGDATVDVGAARAPLAEPNFAEFHPRQLYLEWLSPIGLFRVGQQASHWGSGMLANDGDHPTLFGDYVGGSLVERALFATTPLGKGTPLAIALAGDLVFQDNNARLVEDGDRAFQFVAVVAIRTPSAEIGVNAIYRNQARDHAATGPVASRGFTERLEVGIVDLAGKFHAPAPGARGFVYGELELAAISGSTSFLRGAWASTLDPTAARADEEIRAFGGTARLGFVHVADVSGASKGAARATPGGVAAPAPHVSTFGDLVVEAEYGYATGDANPTDGVSKRFTFDPNHNVGLVLFDHVLAWKTARSATLGSDPRLARRAPAGSSFLPSNGGIFGAQYINPRVIVRPVHWVDLKAGMLLAQATADVVDPYQFVARGRAANYDGGPSTSRDLGLELDLGVDARVRVGQGGLVQVGADGGVLFPGRAFADASGAVLEPVVAGNIKLGVQF